MPATGVHCSAPSVLWHCPLLRCTHALPFLRATAGCLARPFACLAYARGAGGPAPQKRPSRCAPVDPSHVGSLCTEGGYTYLPCNRLCPPQTLESGNSRPLLFIACSCYELLRPRKPHTRPARCACVVCATQILFQENKDVEGRSCTVYSVLLLARTHATRVTALPKAALLLCYPQSPQRAPCVQPRSTPPTHQRPSSSAMFFTRSALRTTSSSCRNDMRAVLPMPSLIRL